MEKSEKVRAYYESEHAFKDAIGILRQVVKKTKLVETYKWNFPTYTLEHKNVLAICRFNKHFSLWFFRGALLKDGHKVLENAQEGKTHAMRHWKFASQKEIDTSLVLNYMKEAVQLQEKGIPTLKKVAHTTAFKMPKILDDALKQNARLRKNFLTLPSSRQKEYVAYIASAKQEATKHRRLKKIMPMILSGKGLNDAYR